MQLGMLLMLILVLLLELLEMLELLLMLLEPLDLLKLLELLKMLLMLLLKDLIMTNYAAADAITAARALRSAHIPTGYEAFSTLHPR